MDDPDRRLALGATGSGRIKTQLAWEYSIPNLLSIYRNVLPAAKISEAETPEEEVREQPIPLEATHPLQLSLELDARLDAQKEPPVRQPDEGLPEAEESTAFSA
jgi:hypothetical protein